MFRPRTPPVPLRSSPKPVYLAIVEGKAELRDADYLMDKKTGEVDDILHAEIDKKAEILQHGPAAENGVLFSSLVSMSNRHNGRTGMGLVMASKNLKAVAVRGTKKVQVADPKALANLNKSGPKILPDNPDMPGLAAEGTAPVVLFQNTIGSLPTLNYNEGQFEACEDISGARMVETILKNRDTCYAPGARPARGAVPSRYQHWAIIGTSCRIGKRRSRKNNPLVLLYQRAYAAF